MPFHSLIKSNFPHNKNNILIPSYCTWCWCAIPLLLCSVSASILNSNFSPGDLNLNAGTRDKAKAVAVANLDTLMQVQILFRHGERTAIEPLVSDSSPEVVAEMKADGSGVNWGRLTNNGKKQTFDLGEYLRRRYGSFVGQEYNSEEVYVVSSDSERTLKSAGTCMLGFYRQFHESASWNPGFDKTVEPIPIRTIPTHADRILRNLERCPQKTLWFIETLTETPYWKQFQQMPTALYDYVRNHSRNPVMNDPTSSAFQKIYAYVVIQDNLIVKKLRNETRPTKFPDWALPLYQNLEFMNTKGRIQLDELATIGKIRLNVGPLFQYLRDNMQEKIAEGKNSKKMIFLSGHDRTISGLLTSLNMYEPNPQVGGLPSFASSLMIELHRNPNPNPSPKNEYFIQFWFRNDTSRDPYYLAVPDCGDPCPYEYFKDVLIQPFIPSDWHHECKLQHDDHDQNPKMTLFSTGTTTKTASHLLSAISIFCITIVSHVLHH